MNARPSALALAIAALALAAPLASASAPLEIASSAPVSWNAAVTASAPAGSMHGSDDDLRAEVVWRNASGRLSVQRWSVAAIRTSEVDLQPTLGRPDEETIALSNAEVVWRATGESVKFRAIAGEDGALRVAGHAVSTGLPTFLERDSEPSDARVDLPDQPRDLRWKWRAGWPFLGETFDKTPMIGKPDWSAPEIALEGEGAMKVEGGELVIRTSDDAPPVVVDLRPGAPGPGGVRRHARAIFEGNVGRAEIPAFASWGISGPRILFASDGALTWDDATGRAGDVDLRASKVTVYGSTRMEMARDARAGPIRYAGEGDWDAVRVDGAMLTTGAPRDTLAMGAALPLAALLAALLVGVRYLLGSAWGLYSRIPAADLLGHPARKRIVELVRERPGVHMRELNRLAGGGWGGFRQHLRLLEAGGYVTLVKAGGQRRVFPGSGSGRRSLHPTAERILQALPADGESVAMRALAERASVSPALARYHLRRLTAEGLVARSTRTGGRYARADASDAS